MTALRFGVVSESVRDGRAWLDFARQPEYEAAGFAFGSAGQRIARLESSLRIIKALLAGTPVENADEFYRIDGLDLDVLPARTSSPRILVGAGGPRMLRLAARYADIVGVLPAPIKTATGDEDPRDRLPEAFDAKVDVLRAAERFADLEISALGTFVITNNRRGDTENLIAERGWSGIDVEQVWQMPTVFIGSAEQIRADLLARRDRFGLSYLVVGEDGLPALTRLLAS